MPIVLASRLQDLPLRDVPALESGTRLATKYLQAFQVIGSKSMRSIRLITRPRHQCLQQEQVYQSSLIAARLPPRRALATTCAQQSSPHNSTSWWSTHRCDIYAEPLHRYQRGGYHPVHLGDCFEGTKGRTYRVLHKLGWGGYSTVWAARDLRSFFFFFSLFLSLIELTGVR